MHPLWKKIWRLLKNLNIDLPYDPAIPLLGIYPKKIFNKYILIYSYPILPYMVATVDLKCPPIGPHVGSLIPTEVLLRGSEVFKKWGVLGVL
jgi:hypothetical protein